jgi:hypothetical protein
MALLERDDPRASPIYCLFVKLECRKVETYAAPVRPFRNGMRYVPVLLQHGPRYVDILDGHNFEGLFKWFV